jgi:hypothetical protein
VLNSVLVHFFSAQPLRPLRLCGEVGRGQNSPQSTQRDLGRNQIVALAPAEPNIYRNRL